MMRTLSHADIVIKFSLSILLLLCLLDMPYGYYQLVRFIATIIFIYLAVTTKSADKNRQPKKIIFYSLALLFQPLFKIALGRTI